MADYERAYKREKTARQRAEQLLEDKSRDLFHAHEAIEKQYHDAVKQKGELEILNKIAQFAHQDLSIFNAMKFFIETVCNKCDLSVGHAFIADQDSPKFLKPMGISYINNESKEDIKNYFQDYLNTHRQARIGVTVAGKCWECQKIQIAIIKNKIEEKTNIASPIQFTAILAAPLIIYNKVVAVAEFFKTTEGELNSNEIRLVETVSLQLGTVLERHRSEKKLQENYTKLHETLEELKNAQDHIVHSEKLASVGQLAAGVAHEINNPVGYISSNVRTLKEYIEVFKSLIDKYSILSNSLEIPEGSEIANQINEINRFQKDNDFAYITDDINQLVSDTLEGTTRVKDIVDGLKNFSRVDKNLVCKTNINECIRSTLKIVSNELKYNAEIITDFGDLPLITCNPGEINQVLANLFVNAGHAIGEKGAIAIITEPGEGFITIRISDDGCGVNEKNLKEIFAPFFTTKDIGKGTGLGLSISHGIIENHGGNIKVESTLGKGTTFIIQLPINNEGNI